MLHLRYAQPGLLGGEVALMRPIHIVTLLLLLLVLAGCSSNTRQQPGYGDNLTPPTFNLPWPISPPRQSSFAIVLAVNGDMPYAASDGATTPSPPQLQLLANADEMEYAVYRLATAGSPLLGIEVSFDVTAGEQCWVGLPDYSREAWSFMGPYDAGPATFSTVDPYWVSPDNDLFVAVVAFDGTTVLVNQLSASADVLLWQNHVVDDTPACGMSNSIASLDGKLVIAYYNSTTDNLRYARSSVAAPSQTSDWVRMVADPSPG